ncbi:MAG TPA: 16S rRNA (cytidine(1402)-2'-O)-methyltransferase [Alphaproteobacteria bacterium]|nr:16S rRNA (cytidine(1402)-2'-O)-methyltransferase [Alphaproteobacteria bacterium]
MGSAQTTPSREKGEPNEREGASKLAPGLYVVATPLGNLGDITARAIAVLRAADLIACEDTRVTARLLQALGIAGPRLIRYDDHAGDNAPMRLLEAVQHGKALALVSDAGTPLIADPGYRLVRAAQEAGLAVRTVPGPSAMVAALSIAGLPTDRFLASGFLPQRAGPRRKALAELAAIPATLVIPEAPHRLAESLADMAAVLGPREAVVARELTKLFEETRRGTLESLAAHYAASGPPKGEIVVVVAPPAEAAAVESEAMLDDRLARALESESVRDAAASVAAATGLPRRRVYARALELARKTR